MSERTGDLLGVLASAVVALGFGFWCARHFPSEGKGPEPVIEVRVDTVVVRDTVVAWKPYPVEVRVTDTVYVELEPEPEDSVLYLPIVLEQKVYEDPDSTYRAVVSGPAIDKYGPGLDTIEVYREKVYIDKVQTIYVQPSRWSVGLQAGYGASKDGLSPYIGVGVQWRLWAPRRSRKAPP